MALKFNRLQQLTAHALDQPMTEAELMAGTRHQKPAARALSQLALKLRGEIGRRKAARSK